MQLLLVTTDIPRLTLHEAAHLLGYKDRRSAKRWCRSHNVALLRDAGTKSSYVIKSEFIAARLRLMMVYLNKRYGAQQYKQALSTYQAGEMMAMVGLTEQDRKGSVKKEKISVTGKNASRFYSTLTAVISSD